MDFSELVGTIKNNNFIDSLKLFGENISINSIIMLIMMIFLLIGAIDKIRGNKRGYGQEFDNGFNAIGPIGLALIGIYAAAPIFSMLLGPIITPIFTLVGADPSMFATTLLSSDMGGYALAQSMAKNETMTMFSGLILGTVMGQTITFTIPVALGILEKKDRPYLAAGVLAGLVGVPFGCIAGGLLMNITSYKISFVTILINLIPVIIFATLLCLGLWFIPTAMIKGFNIFGTGVCIVGTMLTAIAVVQQITGIFLPVFGVMSTVNESTGMTNLDEALLVCGQIGIILMGAYPMAKWITKAFKKPLNKAGKKLGVDDVACSGMIANLANSVPMFSMVKSMSDKGKLLSIAFGVSAAFVFGDHLGFVARTSQEMVFPVIVAKLVAGIFAVAAAMIIAPKILPKIKAIQKKSDESETKAKSL